MSFSAGEIPRAVISQIAPCKLQQESSGGRADGTLAPPTPISIASTQAVHLHNK